MDAVNRKEYNIWFGGSYSESWTQDYHMSVVYHDRRCVTAGYEGGRWIAVGGDEELCEQLRSKDCDKLLQTYFQAAATAYAAAQDCLRRGLPLDRLGECAYFRGNPLVAPELMRLLMDDCGFPMELTYHVCAHCCEDTRAMGVDAMELYRLQPRTAHVVSILRNASSELLAAAHDAREALYRSPQGAVKTGETLRLSLRVMSGRVRSVSLRLWSDGTSETIPMERENGGTYSVTLTAPETPQAMWYAFCIETEVSSHWLCPDATGFIGRLCGRMTEGFRLTVYDRDFDTPAWFRRSVMYQIFPDRFAFSEDGTAERGVGYHRALGQNAELHDSLDEPVRWQPRTGERDYIPDDFYGGTLRGIIARLPYLRELGVSCLYLNPIFEARSNHRYDTADYTRVDPILGSNEDFEELCREASRLGIRILLDGVFSHTGADSVYFNKYGHYDGGACGDPDSPYRGWFKFSSYPDGYKSWWGFEELPEVDKLNPAWQRFAVTGEGSIVRSWLRRGAAGWRLDVADELPDSVLEMIRRSVKAEKPDAPIIGEVWEDAVTKISGGVRRSYALGRALDSVMNYPLRLAVLDFVHGRIDAYALRDFLIGQQSSYPKPMYYSLMNLLGSHDVDRLRSALATDTVIRELPREEQLRIGFDAAALDTALRWERLCAAIQFTIPGVPSIYYGDEQGMCGVCDPFNRLPFREGDRALHDTYASLAALRNSTPVLSTGEARFAACSADVLTILRFITDGRDAFGDSAPNGAYLAVINRSEQEQSFRADCRDAGAGIVSGTVAARDTEIMNVL